MISYASDLTDSQWEVIKVHFDWQRKRDHDLRFILNAIFYLLHTGCQWRYLPHQEVVPWKTIYDYFWRWKKSEKLKKVHESLRETYRESTVREATPSLGLIDSQSVKGSRFGSDRGVDGGKRIKGRKRHILTDTLGLIWVVVVHAANIHDSKGAKQVFRRMLGKFPRMQKIVADGGYRGELIQWVSKTMNWVLEIVIRNPKEKKSNFDPLPKRWIVERTFAWFESYRRLSKEYEYAADTSELMVELAGMKLIINRLDKKKTKVFHKKKISDD